MRARIILMALTMAMATSWAWAGEGDNRLTVSAGFLVPNTLNAVVGFEHELRYGNAWELSFEAGDRYRKDPVCGKYCSDVFWKGYYWAAGAAYKKVLAKGKNSSFRIKGGPQFGAYKGDFTYGGEISFEYNIQLENGVQVSLIQKNQVNFNHGDDFRNGILVAFKIPF